MYYFKTYGKWLFAAIMISALSSWGWQGHQKISRNASLSFPAALNFLLQMNWDDSLAAHASDADYRKSTDPDESPRHYIDIDAYPEFVANGTINQNYNAVVAAHGSTFVIDNGILPWATITTFDSLTACFARQDWTKAMMTASDLGHYVADGHMPLHITANYNGQLTNQTGVHSRYESDMISAFNNQITYQGGTVQHISNVSDYIFNYIYNNNHLVDSILHGDSIAYAQAGNYVSYQYKQKLWNRVGNMTTDLFKNGSLALANLIYTAWINAGSPVAVKEFYTNNSKNLSLLSCKDEGKNLHFSYSLSANASVFYYNIVDLTGKLVFRSENSVKQKGLYNESVNLAGIGQGYYILRMVADKDTLSQKFLFGSK